MVVLLGSHGEVPPAPSDMIGSPGKVPPAAAEIFPAVDDDASPPSSPRDAGAEAVEDAAESPKEKQAREKREKAGKVKEYGGRCSTWALFSMATPLEFLVLFVGVLGAVGNGVGTQLNNVFFGDAVNGGLDPSASLDPMREACYKMFGLAIWQLFAAGLQGFAFPWFAERQARKFRPLYFDALLHRDVGWFDTHQAAALSSEMAAEIDEYVDGIGRKLGNSIMAGALCVSGYSFAFLYSWKLALMVFAFLPLMTLAGPIMYSAMMDITQEKQGAYAKAALVVEECLFAVRTVVGFSGEQYEIDRFTAAAEEARKGGTKNRLKLGFGMGYINAMFFAGYASTFFCAWWLRDNAEDGHEDATLSVGDVMKCFSCALMGGMMFGQTIPGITAIQASRVNLARFFHIIRNESVIERRERDDGSPLGEPARTFELKDVHFSYPARPEQKVLQGVNLSIPEGKKVALVGESGSGKSTIMALLERFYDPTSGAVLVNGKDLRSLSITSVRASIGYVGQEPVLYATTIRKNIRMGCERATDDDVLWCVQHAQMEEFVGRLPDKLDTFVGSGGSQFSGGQKQRIAIARALLKKPSVLFLDEATSALDNRSERQIQGTIDAIGRNDQLKMSIVSIAHRLSTIANSDVIFVLKAGVVVESGSHEDLISRPGGQYQALAAAQNMTSEGGAGEGEPEAVHAAEGERPSGRLRLFSEDVQEGDARGSAAQEEADAEKAREQEILKTYRVPLRRLLQFCRPEWWMIPPGVVFGAVSGVPFIYSLGFVLVDAMLYLALNDRAKIMEAVVTFAVLGGIKWLSMASQYSLIGCVGEAVTKRVRVAVLRSLLSQEIGFHDDPENTPAQLQTVLQLYAMRISRFFIAIGDNSDAISTMACGLVLAFYKCWQLALAMMVSIPILMICMMIDGAAMKGAEQAQSAAAKEAAQLVQDALTNSRTVHAGSNERELVAMFRRTVAEGDVGTKVHVIGGIGMGLSGAAQMGIFGAALLLMAEFIENGTTTFQDGFGSFLAILIAGVMAGQARMFTGDTNKAAVACHDLFKLLDRESMINGLEPTGITPPADMEGIGHLELNDVKFFYPFRSDVQVLKGISFEIQAGTSVGVVGPSGGGKSTIFAMLQRFYDPQDGSVFIGKGVSRVDLSSVNIRWWRRHIGVVGQEPILFDGTVLDNVKYGVGPDDAVSDEHLEDCKQKCFLGFLDKSQGWSTQVGPRGSRLSGGQKQRVAICRALLRNPKVLLLDEATSALDSRSEAVVSRALERARAGRTSFAIAHRLTSIQDCDVIIVVADGKVVETGKHQQLMEKGDVYCKLYESSQNH